MPMTREELIEKIRGEAGKDWKCPVIVLSPNLVIETLNYLQSSHEAVCPCTLATPCNKQCPCGVEFQSGCCRRCCTYGSAEQRKESAVMMVRHEEETIKLLEELARGHCSLDVWCKNVPTRDCIHNKACALLNKIKGE